eukprot:scaffold51565_cov16-Prasinocladus_malaysianus.AAC.1
MKPIQRNDDTLNGICEDDKQMNSQKGSASNHSNQRTKEEVLAEGCLSGGITTDSRGGMLTMKQLALDGACQGFAGDTPMCEYFGFFGPVIGDAGLPTFERGWIHGKIVIFS